MRECFHNFCSGAGAIAQKIENRPPRRIRERLPHRIKFADLSKSPRGEAVKAYLNPRGFRILGALEAVAARHKAKPAEVALAWIMARPAVTAPIASATSIEQVDSLIRATALKLTAADMDGLNAASAP